MTLVDSMRKVDDVSAKPVWLEFFGGQGGTAAGIAAAGFRVVCVDNDPKMLRRNPFETVHADAISDFDEIVRKYDPAVVGGAPPCQGYSSFAWQTKRQYPKLIEPFRKLVLAWGGPYVIENVETARPHLINPILICGSMFAPPPRTPDRLLLKRHRLFESNLPLCAPAQDICDVRKGDEWHHDWRGFINVHGGGASREGKNPDGSRKNHGNKASAAEARALMGIDWMTVEGMNEAIPPRYAEHVARQVMLQICNPFAA